MLKKTTQYFVIGGRCISGWCIWLVGDWWLVDQLVGGWWQVVGWSVVLRKPIANTIKDTVPLTISDHLFRFLLINNLLRKFDISSKKRNTNDKKHKFLNEKQKKCLESISKYKVAFFTVNSPN